MSDGRASSDQRRQPRSRRRARSAWSPGWLPSWLSAWRTRPEAGVGPTPGLWERCGSPVTAARHAALDRWPAWSAGAPEVARADYEALLRDIARAVAATVELDLVFAGESGEAAPAPLCCRVRSAGHRLRVTVPDDTFGTGLAGLSVAHRLAAATVVLASLPQPASSTPSDVVFTLCLGDDSAGHEVGFCDTGGGLLIPDSDFLGSGGYLGMRRFADQARLPWSRRRPTVFWRGSTTGRARAAGSYDPEAEWFRVTQRTEMCRRLMTGRFRDSCDVGITAVVQIEDEALSRRIEAELMRPRVERPWQIWFRHVVDIDGNTSAWAGLFEALLLGACVLKVGSPSGHRQWFYDRLVPWTTHVPVRADLADLEERVGWVLAHPARARRIAARGAELARSIGFDEAVAEAAHLLRARFGKPASIRSGPTGSSAESISAPR